MAFSLPSSVARTRLFCGLGRFGGVSLSQTSRSTSSAVRGCAAML